MGPCGLWVFLGLGLGCCYWQIKGLEAWFVLAVREARGQARLYEGAATKNSQSGEQNRTEDICSTRMQIHTWLYFFKFFLPQRGMHLQSPYGKRKGQPTTHVHNKITTHEIMLLHMCSTFANTLFWTVAQLVMKGGPCVEKGEEGSILEEVHTGRIWLTSHW